MHLHELLTTRLVRLSERKGAAALDIVETGTIRAAGDEYRANDGWSTLLFAMWVKEHGGTFISVDLETDVADKVLTEAGLREHVKLVRGHSIDVLARLLSGGNRFDVAYLDSDNDADLILHEFLVARLMIRSPGLILVDDVDPSSLTVRKGHAIVPWLQRDGIEYQIVPREGTGYRTGVMAIEV